MLKTKNPTTDFLYLSYTVIISRFYRVKPVFMIGGVELWSPLPVWFSLDQKPLPPVGASLRQKNVFPERAKPRLSDFERTSIWVAMRIIFDHIELF